MVLDALPAKTGIHWIVTKYDLPGLIEKLLSVLVMEQFNMLQTTNYKP